MSQLFDFDEIVRRWQLGYLNGEDLPGIACLALEAGFDASALYELAGLDRPSLREAGPIFKRALDELGRFSETIEEQPLYFAFELARRILAREVGLIAGCREMVAIRNRGNLHECKDLDPFVGVESETDALPLGPVRGRWSAEALIEADHKIAQAEGSYRETIDDACRTLIQRTNLEPTQRG
jgi:hypothetical protein